MKVIWKFVFCFMLLYISCKVVLFLFLGVIYMTSVEEITCIDDFVVFVFVV